MLCNEITIFRPNSRRKESTISGPVASKVVNALEMKLGEEAAKRAREAFATMKKQDIDFLQFRVEDRKVRLRLTEA